MDTYVVNGCSAGGLAVLTWADYINNRIKVINPNIHFYGYSDSGIFPIYPSFQT